MKITLDIPDDLAGEFAAAAQRSGISVEHWIVRVAKMHIGHGGHNKRLDAHVLFARYQRGETMAQIAREHDISVAALSHLFSRNGLRGPRKRICRGCGAEFMVPAVTRNPGYCKRCKRARQQ